MSSQNRYVVVPTVTVLAVMKARLVGAVKGHALLKKKADALTMRYVSGVKAQSTCQPTLTSLNRTQVLMNCLADFDRS